MTSGSDRLGQIEAVLLRVATQQEVNTLALAELTARMAQAAVERAELRVEAEADRKMIVATLEHLDEIHAENQRILNYLFGQQRGNGHGDQPK